FFFQAEDGIRDFHVTGVQTCALPILHEKLRPLLLWVGFLAIVFANRPANAQWSTDRMRAALTHADTLIAREVDRGALPGAVFLEIGRASCRGRGEISMVGGGGSVRLR